MKNLLFLIVFLFTFSWIQVQAQKNVNLTTQVSVLADTTTTPGTTLYWLRTAQVNDAGTVVNDDLEPKGGPLPAAEFINWFYSRTRYVEQQEVQHKLIRGQLKRQKDMFISLIDTLAGAGTYYNVLASEVLHGLSGGWKLRTIRNDTLQGKTVVNITADTLTNGKKTGLITVVDATNFQLVGWVNATLNFTLRHNGAWVAVIGKRRFVLRK